MYAVLDTLYKTSRPSSEQWPTADDSNGGKLLETIIQHEIMIDNSSLFL